MKPVERRAARGLRHPTWTTPSRTSTSWAAASGPRGGRPADDARRRHPARAAVPHVRDRGDGGGLNARRRGVRSPRGAFGLYETGGDRDGRVTGPMRRAERLFRLVNEMRSRRISRARELASALEVSVGTIYREHRASPGVGPSDRRRGRRGDTSCSPGFDLPNVAFTHDPARRAGPWALSPSSERTGRRRFLRHRREGSPAPSSQGRALPPPPRSGKRARRMPPFYSASSPGGRRRPTTALVRRAIREQRGRWGDRPTRTGGRQHPRAGGCARWWLGLAEG